LQSLFYTFLVVLNIDVFKELLNILYIMITNIIFIELVLVSNSIFEVIVIALYSGRLEMPDMFRSLVSEHRLIEVEL